MVNQCLQHWHLWYRLLAQSKCAKLLESLSTPYTEDKYWSNFIHWDHRKHARYPLKNKYSSSTAWILWLLDWNQAGRSYRGHCKNMESNFTWLAWRSIEMPNHTWIIWQQQQCQIDSKSWLDRFWGCWLHSHWSTLGLNRDRSFKSTNHKSSAHWTYRKARWCSDTYSLEK